ncbi:hypothetical protein C0J52_15340, partial [Blattella germanica]
RHKVLYEVLNTDLLAHQALHQSRYHLRSLCHQYKQRHQKNYMAGSRHFHQAPPSPGVGKEIVVHWRRVWTTDVPSQGDSSSPEFVSDALAGSGEETTLFDIDSDSVSICTSSEGDAKVLSKEGEEGSEKGGLTLLRKTLERCDLDTGDGKARIKMNGSRLSVIRWLGNIEISVIASLMENNINISRFLTHIIRSYTLALTHYKPSVKEEQLCLKDSLM